jgi:hypothetical protein
MLAGGWGALAGRGGSWLDGWRRAGPVQICRDLGPSRAGVGLEWEACYARSGPSSGRQGLLPAWLVKPRVLCPTPKRVGEGRRDMAAARTSWGMIGAVLLLSLASAGCAQVVGIDEFSLAKAGSAGDAGCGGETAVGVCAAVHDCTRDGATDLTRAPDIYISFSEAGYNSRCIRADSGVKVNFSSTMTNFDQIPIAGGIFPDVDPCSPIKNPADPMAMQASFVLSGACAFPYFSPMTGQTGAIFLE